MIFGSWEDGDHFKRMVGLSPRAWRLSNHNAIFVSHLSAWFLLNDFHRDVFSTLLAQVDGGFVVPRLLMADVDRDIASLSLRGGCSCSCSVEMGAPVVAAPPALVPLDFKLDPLTLHSGLDLKEKRESWSHIIIGHDPSQVYGHSSWAYQRLRWVGWTAILI